MGSIVYRNIINKSKSEVDILETVVSKCESYQDQSLLSKEEVDSISNILNNIKEREYIKGYSNIENYYREKNIDKIIND